MASKGKLPHKKKVHTKKVRTVHRVYVNVGQLSSTLTQGRPHHSSYSSMKKETAAHFGWTALPSAPKIVNHLGHDHYMRGARHVHIKVIDSLGDVWQIPIPSGMTISEISKFLKTAKSNKPKAFIGKSGGLWHIAA